MDASNNPALADTGPMWFYNLVLAEVVFVTKKNGVQILRRQFFEKSSTTVWPANRVKTAQNSAAMQVYQQLDKDEQDGYQILDIFILSIQPLGGMSDEEFWNGIGMETAEVAIQRPTETAQDGHVATSDNVTPIHSATPPESRF
jgi:hypothetical protein